MKILTKQTVVLSSNIGEADKLRSLASFGKALFNVRYMSTLELARYLLQLSGITIDKRFVSNDDLAAIMYKDIKKINYFKNFSYSDILNLVNSVNDLRRYIVSDEPKEIKKLPLDKFVNKNKAILEYYELLMNTLGDEYIDEIGTIRYAYEHISSITGVNFVIYEGDSLLGYSLDMALLNKANGGPVAPTKIGDDRPTKIDGYMKAFSQVNEVENILSYIYKHHLPFDQCLIASAETKDYSNVLTNYSDLLQFPLTIGVGKNIIETNPGKLFSIIIDFDNNNYHTEYLKRIIFDECFNIDKFKSDLSVPSDDFAAINKGLDYRYRVSLDSIVTTVGDLRLSFDNPQENNKRLKNYKELIDKYSKEQVDPDSTKRRETEFVFVQAFVEVLNKGLYNFIESYSKVDGSPADKNALDKILKLLHYESKYGVKHEDVVKSVFLQNVGRKSPNPSSLYFTSINNAASALRKHLFIIGLSSNNYPGGSKENAIILDRDYQAFGVNEASNREVENNKNAYFSLIKLANYLDCEVHLSYAYYNSETLKMQNASSVVFETYKLENGDNKTLKDFNDEFYEKKANGKKQKRTTGKYIDVEYFQSDILPVSKIGRTLSDNLKIEYKPVANVSNPNINGQIPASYKKKKLSASSIVQYAECPYKFYLSKILGIEQPEKINIYELIPANEYGTLAHYLLETLDKKNTNLDTFLQRCAQMFDEYFIIHYTDNVSLKDEEKSEFLQMMTIAYILEENDPSVIKEEDIEIEYKKTGLTIHGLPDKVIRLSNGQHYVIDYKTGKSNKYNLKKFETIAQCVVYSYLVQSKLKLPVDGFEFRCIRINSKTSSFDDSKTMTEYFNDLDIVMNNIEQSYNTGEFTPNLDHCKNCWHTDVCPRRKR